MDTRQPIANQPISQSLINHDDKTMLRNPCAAAILLRTHVLNLTPTYLEKHYNARATKHVNRHSCCMGEQTTTILTGHDHRGTARPVADHSHSHSILQLDMVCLCLLSQLSQLAPIVGDRFQDASIQARNSTIDELPVKPR